MNSFILLRFFLLYDINLIRVEEFTYQPYSPVGLDLKLLERALEEP